MWPTVLGLSHTANLIRSHIIDVTYYSWSLDQPYRIIVNFPNLYGTAMLQTSKLIHAEATPVFYASLFFRFNSEQIRTLRQKTDIINSLVNIEIEDFKTAYESWDLLDTLSELSSGRHMRTITVGVSSLRNALRTPFHFEESGGDSTTRRKDEEIWDSDSSCLESAWKYWQRYAKYRFSKKTPPKVVFKKFICNYVERLYLCIASMVQPPCTKTFTEIVENGFSVGQLSSWTSKTSFSSSPINETHRRHVQDRHVIAHVPCFPFRRR